MIARVSEAGFKSASARLPAGPKGQTAAIGFGTIMVMDKAKNREAGWAFARFIGLEAANGAFWNISFGQLPPRLSFREDPSWKEYEKNNPLVPPFVEAQKSARLNYFGPGAQEIGTEMGKAVEAAQLAVAGCGREDQPQLARPAGVQEPPLERHIDLVRRADTDKA